MLIHGVHNVNGQSDVNCFVSQLWLVLSAIIIIMSLIRLGLYAY